MLIQVTRTAAIAIAGFDVMSGILGRVSPRPRTLRRAGLSGSAVVGDCQIRVLVDGDQVANLFNSKLLPAHANTDLFNVAAPVAGNAEILAPMITGATTSPIYLTLELS
jgi:hypothetical protein